MFISAFYFIDLSRNRDIEARGHNVREATYLIGLKLCTSISLLICTK